MLPFPFAMYALCPWAGTDSHLLLLGLCGVHGVVASRSLPTLFVSECVLVYLDPHEGDQLLK